MNTLNKLNKMVSNDFPAEFQEKWLSDEIQKKIKRVIKKKVGAADKDTATQKEEREHSPYIKFCKGERECIKTENPDLNAKEIISKLGERWNHYKQNDPEYLKDKYNYDPKSKKDFKTPPKQLADSPAEDDVEEESLE